MVNQRKFDPQAPLQEGEFQRIKGIAEATEKALHEAGIETFEALALLSPQEIAGKLKGVGVLEKITRLDWTGQAAEFARQLAGSTPPVEKDEPEGRQHYESFMVGLLLDDEHEVRRTRVSHIPTGLEANWAGWDEPRLVNWIAAQARLPEKLPMGDTPTLEDEPAMGQPGKPGLQQPAGVLHLSRLQITTPVSKQVIQTVYPDARFGLRFKLDFSEAEIPLSAPLQYQAEIQIHNIRGWKHAFQDQIAGKVPQEDEPPYIEALVPGLPEGVYHLEAAVQVYPASSTDTTQDGLHALAEGLLLRVTWDEPKQMTPERREKITAEGLTAPNLLE